jgi:hypothetical protein
MSTELVKALPHETHTHYKRRARSVPKSVSAEITIRSSPAARSKLSISTAGPKADVAHVESVVSCGGQSARHVRREGVVDEELHETATSGSSRSRTDSAAYCNASRSMKLLNAFRSFAPSVAISRSPLGLSFSSDEHESASHAVLCTARSFRK